MVKEVLSYPQVARLPNAARYILGVYNLRGRIITLVDLQRILGIASDEKRKSTLVLLIGTNGSTLSFVIDKMHEFIELDQEKIQNKKANANVLSSAYLLGDYQHEKLGSLVLIDAKRLLTLDKSHFDVKK